jgi:hypothetical protein
MDPIRINNPSYCGLVFNNTCSQTGRVGTFDHSKRNDLFACRYSNNIFNQEVSLPDHVALYDNPIIQTPSFKDPDNRDYRLQQPVDRAVGAYAPDGALWRAGCDLEHPPSPVPTYRPPRVDWMNALRNSCFELGTLEGWQKTDALRAVLVKGNGWGNPVHGSSRGHATGTSKFELRLGPGRDGVSQVVGGLGPNVTYTLSAWLRVSEEGEAVVLGVTADDGAQVRVSASSTEWTRKSVQFTTGAGVTQATVELLKSTAGDGHAWCDNLTLPLRPAQTGR